jgi:hypothetical protein
MTFESEADRHAADAARAIHEGNVASARAALEVAKKNVETAEANLAKHLKENS